MNDHHSSSSSAARELAQIHFARRIVARLNEDADHLDNDVVERLRFAREQALARARTTQAPALAAASVGVTGAGAALLGGGSGWRVKLASIVPLVALVCGLVLIQNRQTKAQISVAAEVDAALLADDLPPSAYGDPGFAEFLKAPAEQ